jgi:hypothetical protein
MGSCSLSKALPSHLHIKTHEISTVKKEKKKTPGEVKATVVQELR